MDWSNKHRTLWRKLLSHVKDNMGIFSNMIIPVLLLNVVFSSMTVVCGYSRIKIIKIMEIIFTQFMANVSTLCYW